MNENTAKMILVIDRPESCDVCPLRSYSNLELVCTPMRTDASDVVCPLRPMPKKKNEELVIKGHTGEIAEAYQDGWNECIEEITGETE